MKHLKLIGKKKPPNNIIPENIIVSDLIEDIASNSSVPMVNTFDQVTESNTKSPLVEELERALENKINNIGQPDTINEPIISYPSENISKCHKEKIDNSSLLELLENNKIDKDDLFSDSAEFECKKLINNMIVARETARFTVTVDNHKTVQGFFFHIHSMTNFLNSNHIENIEGNKVSLVINNLMNKDVTFDINYLAIF
jgi:hypothetical protein